MLVVVVVLVLVVEAEQMRMHWHLLVVDTMEVERVVMAFGYCGIAEVVSFERGLM